MKTVFAAALVAAFSATSAMAAADWGNQCASFGLSRGTAGFNQCVAKMSVAHGANRTGNGAPAAQQQQLVGQAPQRGVSIVGSWSAGEPQNGTAFAFNPDGTYVNVSGNRGGSGNLDRGISGVSA